MFTRQEKHNEREPEVNVQKQRQARENARYQFSLEFGQILMKQIQRNSKITWKQSNENRSISYRYVMIFTQYVRSYYHNEFMAVKKNLIYLARDLKLCICTKELRK